MYRGNFGNRFRDRQDRNRLARTPVFRRNEIPSRFSVREDDQRTIYGPAELLDRRENEHSYRNFEVGQNSDFGTPNNFVPNSMGRKPQIQLFPSPNTPGSSQHPFSFGGSSGNSISGSSSDGQN